MGVIYKEAPGMLSFEGSAGAYFEGSTLVIQHVGVSPPPSVRGLANQELGWDRASISFREVAKSSAELTSYQRRIHAIAERAGAPDAVPSVAELTRTNSLEVALGPPATPQIIQEIEDLLQRGGVSYSFENSDVRVGACTSRQSCNSAQRAGVGLNLGGSVCSSGWVVNRSGVRYALTAGHCWADRNSGTVTSGTAGAYGTLNSVNTYQNGSHADLRLIRTTSSRAWIYRSSATKAQTVTGISLPFVDGTACLYGRNSEAVRCGTITSTNTSCSSGGVTIYGLVRSSTNMRGGDSGGAVSNTTTGSAARGVASCYSSTTMTFTNISYLSTYGLGSVATE